MCVINSRYSRGRGNMVSPERDMDRDLGDSASDIESVVSAYSTKSEQPRGSRKIRYRCMTSFRLWFITLNSTIPLLDMTTGKNGWLVCERVIE